MKPSCLCLLIASLAFSNAPLGADLMSFWDAPRKGGNSFNRLPPDADYFQALSGFGSSWVRLSYDKWQPEQRDFLLGNADHYQGLASRDLATLRAALDRAHGAGLKVVIAPLSLPGMRWSQNNQGAFDDRLWQDRAWWGQAASFWRDLAQALADHPAVAAYNVINEPAPEKLGGLAEHADAARMAQWYATQAGTARDLPAFYEQVIAAIREVDPATPIMLDSGWYAAADAFTYWPKPLSDQKLLYSVHMYEPYAATSAPNMLRKTPYAYPGAVPFGGAQGEHWNAERVRAYLQQPQAWAARHDLPSNRLVVGEFGCMRRLPGCATYLEDVLDSLEEHSLHWAFYSFREDNWDGMDYELGTAKVPWSYWQAAEQGLPDPVQRRPSEMSEIIQRRMRAPVELRAH